MESTGEYWRVLESTGEYRKIEDIFERTGEYGTVNESTGEYRKARDSTINYGILRENINKYWRVQEYGRICESSINFKNSILFD